MIKWIQIKYLSEPTLLKAKLWRLAERVMLETALPPVFGKESWQSIYCAKHLLEVLFYYRQLKLES